MLKDDASEGFQLPRKRGAKMGDGGERRSLAKAAEGRKRGNFRGKSVVRV